MNGIARTVVQLLYGSGLQRGLTVIGLVMTLFGFAALLSGWHPAAQFLFALLGILGVALTAISPVVVGALVFRAMSAPRAVQLIRHGRLKLALGAFSAQLVLAVFISVTVSALLLAGPGTASPFQAGISPAAILATGFVLSFSALTLYFLGFYLALQFRFGACIFLIYVFLPGLVARTFPQAHLGALLVTPRGLIALLSLGGLAWLLFASAFVTQRHIYLPNMNLVGSGPNPLRRPAPVSRRAHSVTPYSRPAAMRVMLTGIPSIRGQSFLIILIICLTYLAAVVLTMRAAPPARTTDAFGCAFIICLLAALAQAVRPGIMTRRAKPLWLWAPMNRDELFTAIERQSWTLLAPVLGTAMVLALVFVTVISHALPPPAPLVGILGMPLVTAASGIYISLLLVRGFRRADTAFLVIYTVLLMVELIMAVRGSPKSALPLLLGMQIILLPLLRHIAQRRWHTIDWLVHRSTSAAQLAG
jgi:hypothetical protein